MREFKFIIPQGTEDVGAFIKQKFADACIDPKDGVGTTAIDTETLDTTLTWRQVQDMLTTKESCWPDDDNPRERYLHVTGSHIWSDTRIVIDEEKVYADDAEIIFSTEEELEAWVGVLRQAWQIKAKQDKKGWRKRE